MTLPYQERIIYDCVTCCLRCDQLCNNGFLFVVYERPSQGTHLENVCTQFGWCFLHFVLVCFWKVRFISHFSSWKKTPFCVMKSFGWLFVYHTGSEAATPGHMPGTGAVLWHSVPVGWWLICSPSAHANGSLRHDEGYVFWRLQGEQCQSCKLFPIYIPYILYYNNTLVSMYSSCSSMALQLLKNLGRLCEVA
jgi:hypothetical protein